MEIQPEWWIPVIAAWGGTLLAVVPHSILEWRRGRTERDLRRMEARGSAYAAFLAAVQESYALIEQYAPMQRGLHWFNAAGRLRLLRETGAWDAMIRRRRDVLETYSLVLAWGSKRARTAARELLDPLVTGLEEGSQQKKSEESEFWRTLLGELDEKRNAFLSAVHADLETRD